MTFGLYAILEPQVEPCEGCGEGVDLDAFDTYNSTPALLVRIGRSPLRTLRKFGKKWRFNLMLKGGYDGRKTARA